MLLGLVFIGMQAYFLQQDVQGIDAALQGEPLAGVRFHKTVSRNPEERYEGTARQSSAMIHHRDATDSGLGKQVVDRSSEGMVRSTEDLEAGSTATFLARMQRLQAWLLSRNGTVNPRVKAVEGALRPGLAAAGGDQGLVAAARISAGELLIFVPTAALVHQAMAGHHPIVAEVRDLLTRERERCVACTVRDRVCISECHVLSSETNEEAINQISLAVWLLQEQHNSNSSWKPWLDLLPNNFESSPIALSEPMLRVTFDGTELAKEVLEVQSAWRFAHEVLSRASRSYRELAISYKVSAVWDKREPCVCRGEHHDYGWDRSEVFYFANAVRYSE